MSSLRRMNAIREPCFSEHLQNMFQKRVGFFLHSVFLTLGFNSAHNGCIHLSLCRSKRAFTTHM